jgi:hypothetical protein
MVGVEGSRLPSRSAERPDTAPFQPELKVIALPQPAIMHDKYSTNIRF